MKLEGAARESGAVTTVQTSTTAAAKATASPRVIARGRDNKQGTSQSAPKIFIDAARPHNAPHATDRQRLGYVSSAASQTDASQRQHRLSTGSRNGPRSMGTATG